ncbi:uncharacterized protein LOC105791525 isoform X2 [Gossypium raimondii]|uniref:Uncharacterized protein n=2 Tax=Gossypium raimondii TaxID=29730 RepID=A0A0D2LRV3_GOSRA|nr:uncharacterized protein LOC105791525 isoform X2 [Gossypium raimondii]KJB06772.1 hypothetical protein B456_001G011400 [Gossypium raimondii]
MPGTIQVSVLDFKGLQSTSPSSQSVKVSMGKTEYQTCDKGEFLFPLTTLHDNLIITLQGADGNEITHAVVETKLVVEKGVWDNIFSLEGGWHVHMKLQFVLSEEEHQRIRVMREAALKKKHEELCKSGHGSPERASIGYSEVSVESLSRSGLLADEDTKFDRSYPIQKQKNTDTVPLELENVNTSKKQGPAVKAHSNIKKMISAFEGSLNQDVKPSAKPPPTISRTRKIGIANSHLNDVETEKMVPPKVDVDAATATEINEDGNNSEKLRPRSENSEDPQDSIGPFGQVIKVIIMVGFATLVLLTRKRTYR